MNTDTLRNEVVTYLRSREKDWRLEDIEAIDKEHVLAVAAPRGDIAAFDEPVLLFKCEGGFVDIHLRKLLTLGNGATSTNTLTAGLLEWVVSPEDKSELTSERVFILRQMIQQRLTETWGLNDVLTTVILGSNDITRLTKAVKDARDGEIYVSCSIPLNQDQLPACFGGIVGAVLQHGLSIVQCAYVMRNVLLPDDSTPAVHQKDNEEDAQSNQQGGDDGTAETDEAKEDEAVAL